MTKPLKIAPWVVPEDLQTIYDYHRAFSEAKAERIVAEYDRVIAEYRAAQLAFVNAVRVELDEDVRHGLPEY